MKRYFLLCLFCIASIAFAQSPKQKLSDLLSNMKQQSADFSQTVTSKPGSGSMSGDRKMSGEFYMQRSGANQPSMLLWRTIKPNKTELIIKRDNVWFHQVDLQQAIHLPARSAESFLGLLIGGQVDKALATYNVTEPQINTFLLKTIKANNESPVKDLKLTFNAQKQLTGLSYQNNFDELTTYKFAKISNKRINEKLFDTNFPKGTDIIDESKGSS